MKGANTFERKTELIKRLSDTFSGGTPLTAEALTAIMKDYNITRESDETRSDLRRRIKYYLGAKKIDGLSERTLKNYKANLESFAAKVEKSAAKITTETFAATLRTLTKPAI
mgnify:CR=1 FL=1